MVGPPAMLHSAEVHNNSAVAVSVTVTFHDSVKDNKDIFETVEIAAGGSHHFESKEVDMGSYQAYAPVKEVSVSHANGAETLTPSVMGVVSKMDFHVGPDMKLSTAQAASC